MKRKLFSSEEEAAIVEAIRRTEFRTSGEIRVHVAARMRGSALEHAYQIFEKLKMKDTKLRNGVLFYIAPKEKQIAVIGDQGIHERVTDVFWNERIDEIKVLFASGEYTRGIIEAIENIGKVLELHFPYEGENDINELPNEISY